MCTFPLICTSPLPKANGNPSFAHRNLVFLSLICTTTCLFIFFESEQRTKKERALDTLGESERNEENHLDQRYSRKSQKYCQTLILSHASRFIDLTAQDLVSEETHSHFTPEVRSLKTFCFFFKRRNSGSTTYLLLLSSVENHHRPPNQSVTARKIRCTPLRNRNHLFHLRV